MFKSEASLFLSANNNINSAKTTINECIRLLLEVELPDDSDYNNCKSNLSDSGIDVLINKVETTKESLMKLDQEFAGQYMTLLQEYLQNQTIDTSKMTEEERMQYNIQMNAYARDYNQTLLYMLEKYEDSGMLTEEMQQQLKYQRELVSQYDIQDKMAVLAPTTDEYIDLYKQNAEMDRKLINLNPSFTEEQKANYLKEYEQSFKSNLDVLELNRDISKKNDELKEIKAGTEEYYSKQNEIYQLQIDYYNNKEVLTDAEKTNLKSLNDYKKLNNLYIEKEGLDDNWIPFDGHSLDDEIFSLKRDMGIATDDEIEYLNMNGWERTLHHTGTFVTSVFEGIYNVEEQIFDGGVMICGEVGSWFGADTKWAEDIIEVDLSGDAYRGVVLSTGLNENIAYGVAHEAGNFTGEMAATIALQFLPGGTLVMTAAHGLKGMGSAGEKALKQGHDWDTAFKYGAATGTIEAASAYLLYGKAGKAKVVDYPGTWITKGVNKIPGVSSATSWIGGKMPGVVKNYAKEVFKPSLVSKFVVAGGKEYAKEYAGVIIGEEFNKAEAWENAKKSMITTAVNEFIVSPAVNKVTSQKTHSKKVSTAEETTKRTTRRIEKMEKIKELEASEAKASVDELKGGVEHTGTGFEKIPNLEQAILSQKDQLMHAWDDVNLWDEFVGKNFVNKFAKKIGSEYTKEVVIENLKDSNLF